jgi:carnitine O-acetyltransferase
LTGHQDDDGRTFGNEDKLPRVPLPDLADSCDRFLEWCAPLLTPDEVKDTKAAVESFLRPDSPAQVLQTALEKYDACERVHSWLDEFWPYRYLGRRDRIAVNANFFFLFRDSERDQVRGAAGLIMAALHYKLLVDEERIPPVVQHGRPLSMEQNKFLFSTTRIPGVVQDSVRAPYSGSPPRPSRARHILVFFRRNMYRMDVIGSTGRPHTLDELAAGLRAVMAEGAARAEPGPSIGPLTTQARADWARNRQALRACDPGNTAVLDEVETALFCVCLEDGVPEDTQEAADRLLHGDSGNRWFDKAVSFIVFGDGTAGVNVEHCELDGTTVLSFVDTMLETPPGAHAAGAGARSQGAPAFGPLRFGLDEALAAEVHRAAADFDHYAAATATMTESFPDFGAATAKRLGMSPDAFVQMAYQLAHHRALGFVGATYESIATRQYRRGRTEAMRVVSPEVVAFVQAMAGDGADRATRRQAFRAAADQHVTRARQCQVGDAPEQHLWELQLIQERHGEELGVTEPLALYTSPGWLKMRDDYLSTSSAPSRNIEYFGFGSTSSHCIGIGYVLLADRLNIYLSTPRAVAERMSRFAAELRVALRDLVELLSEDRPPS